MTDKILKSSFFCFFAVSLSTLPLIWCLWGGQLINGHDSIAGYIRALSMNKYLGQGQTFVRWSPEVNWGYGYPMFNFYPPLFSFVSMFFFQITQNMVMAVNCSCIFFLLLSGYGMFLFAREIWGIEGGLACAFLYIYAPYHIIDLYVRGAFAEFSAFAFFPLLLFSIHKTSREGCAGYFILGVVSVFGLSLAHNIMSMLFFPIAVLYMLFLNSLNSKPKGLFFALCFLAVGLLMSSFFWFPALVEKKYLNLSFLVSMRYDYHQSFITLSQLFWPFNKYTSDGVSYRAGLVQTLFCLICLLSWKKIAGKNQLLRTPLFFFFGVAFIAVSFSMSFSHPLWEHIGILRFVQFPWRLLAIIVFSMSVIGGSVVLLIKDITLRRVMLVILALSLPVFSKISIPRPLFFYSQELPGLDNFVALGEGEYVPNGIIVPPNRRPESKLQLVRGHAEFGNHKALNFVHDTFTIKADEVSLICYHTFNFPGWKVILDGHETKLYPNLFGLIVFIVPPGDHDVQVIFGSTPARAAGTVVSWVGFLLFIACICWFKRCGKLIW